MIFEGITNWGVMNGMGKETTAYSITNNYSTVLSYRADRQGAHSKVSY